MLFNKVFLILPLAVSESFSMEKQHAKQVFQFGVSAATYSLLQNLSLLRKRKNWKQACKNILTDTGLSTIVGYFVICCVLWPSRSFRQLSLISLDLVNIKFFSLSCSTLFIIYFF